MAHILIVPKDETFYDVFYIDAGTKKLLGTIGEAFIPTAEWFYRAEGLEVRIK